MPDIAITITQEQHDAVAAGLPDDPKKPKSDQTRVEEYLQGQVEAIAEQFVLSATQRRLTSKGLPGKLVDVGLKADELAALEAFADAKPKP